MSKRFLIAVLMLIGIVAGNATAQIDPATVTTGHVYLFDNVSGSQLPDDSANNNTGTIVGNPQVVDGLNGKALQFDGVDDLIRIPDSANINTGGPWTDRTIIAVFKCDDVTKQSKQTIFDEGGRTRGLVIYVFAGQVYAGGWNRSEYNWNGAWLSTPIGSNEWHAVTIVLRNTTGAVEPNKFEMWLDGNLINTAAGGQLHAHGDDNGFGGTNQNTVFHDDDGNGTDRDFFAGAIDEIWILNVALTKAELSAIGPKPTKAKEPVPANSATDVLRETTLAWKPGKFGDMHDVYFGTSFTDVNNATRLDPMGPDQVYKARLDTESYVFPERLDFGQTYYWRVDEVNAPPNNNIIFKGTVWSFTTELVGYPIDGANITATASSSGQINLGPENSINGSGLDENDLHSTVADDMWLSGNEPQGAWVQYEFDKTYKLYQMWVWNSNQSFESLFGFGFKDVTVEYSTDGADWTALADVTEFARAPSTAGYAHNTTVDFGGAGAKYVKLTASSNWGGVLPQYGLSEVRFFSIPVSAREPSPDPGTANVAVDGILSWRAGREAATHNVYVSTDQQAVTDATAPMVSVADASYSASLDLASTYYWRVDEVNDIETTTWQGDVWDFSTQEFIVVEDFEDYNDYPPYEIYTTWVDGYEIPANGSQVGNLSPPLAETMIIHGGAQSMPLFYSNTGGATYSEATRTFAAPQNWTRHNIKTLTLWFRGNAANTGQLYVKINNSKIPYNGQAGNIALTGWSPWNIDLTALGLNLQSVSSLAIGVDGNGAAGTLYVDDIRLYSYERQLITPVTPNTVGLIGHWTFDGNTQDASGKGNHGTSGVTPAAFVAGKEGSNAMDFRGADYVIIDGVVDDITSTDLTLSAWIKTTQSDEGNVFAANDASSGHPLMFGVTSGSPFVNDGSDWVFPLAVNDDQWHLLTYVRSGDTGYVYVDGILQGTYSAAFTLDSVTRWSIGQEWDAAGTTSPSDFYEGAVDDARIYNYALSEGEVAWLSGRTEPFDKPF